MINDVPNDFVQILLSQDKDEIIIMKIWGAMVDILCEIRPEIHKPYVRFDKNNGEKILYVCMLKFLQAMLIASLFYYNKPQKDIESIGFEVNPYDTCLDNRMVNGK